MQQFINVLVNILTYSDTQQSNNPKLRDMDYARKLIGISTENSFDRRLIVPPSSSIVVATTARALSQDATTQYQVVLYSGNTFRWTYTAGTNPVLKTQRTLTYDATTEFNVTRNGDVVKYQWNGVGADPDFIANGVISGDTLHVEASGNFNALNEITLPIVGVGANYIEVLNDSGVAETGIAAGGLVGGIYIPIDIFASSGVQIGDEVKISSSAFNIENQGIFTITAVTSQYFELDNGNPGVPEGPFAIGDADSVVFYPSIFKWCYVESDQKVSVRINADVSNNVEIEPISAGDPDQIGVYLQRGGVWKIVIANNGTTPANIKVSLFE